MFVWLFLAELSGNNIHQTPSELIRDPNQEVLMKCSHSNSNFDMIQWYKESAGENKMLLVGYARFSSVVVEDQFKDSFKVSGDGGSLSSLQIEKCRSEDSAVYFCAASEAQCCTHPLSPTKFTSDGASRTNCHMNNKLTTL